MIEITQVSPEGTVSGPKKKPHNLKQGRLGCLLLTCLGVSFVISGDYAGWQYGLAKGGWGGMCVALLLVTALYFAMSLVLAELGAALPNAGGGYKYANTALGKIGGNITAAALLLEYVFAPAAVVTFIGSYLKSLELFSLDADWVLYLAIYVIFMAINLAGACEAISVMLITTGIAIIGLIAYCVVMLPHFSPANLSNGIALFPEGTKSVWLAIPFAIWFYLAVEGVPLAAEEAKKPHKTIPRAVLSSMLILMIGAFSMVIIGPGAAGTNVLAQAENPLVAGLQAINANPIFITLINITALIALMTSFFSIMYGYSRLVFGLSKEQLLPSLFSRVNRRGTPVWALILPGLFGFVLSLCAKGDTLMSICVFGAVTSYAFMILSHIILRRTNPALPRPYRTPGGMLTSGIALTLSIGAICAIFVSNIRIAIISCVLLAAISAFFTIRTRHHLPASITSEPLTV